MSDNTMAGAEVSLDDLSPEASAPRKLRIDGVEKYFPGKGSLSFQYDEPSVAETFQAAHDAEAIKRRHPLWPDTLCQLVAVMAISHRIPSPGRRKSRADFYCEMVDNAPLFEYVSARWQAAFPRETADEAKNA